VRGLLVALILVGLTAIQPGPAQAQTQAQQEAIELLAQIQKVYGGVKGMRARYLGSNQPGVMAGPEAKTKEGEGLFIYGRPNLLRMIQERPSQEELVMSPEGVWWYRKDLGEAHRYPASEFYTDMEPYLGPIMDLLGGSADLSKNFTIERLYGGDEKKNRALKLVPHSHASGLDRIRILIDPEGYIVRVRLNFISGDVTTYDFKDIQLLDHLPEEGFLFFPPEGAKIIHH